MTLLALLALLPPAARAGARPVSAPVEGNCQAPLWSPDGSKLAWEVNFLEKKSVDLYVYTPGSAAARKIQPPAGGSTGLTAGFSTPAAERVTHQLSFSPASQGHFVYSSSTSARDYDLYLDTGGALAPGPSMDGDPAWSPDGRAIVFSSTRGGEGDLYLLATGALDQPPRRLTSTPDRSELYADWSPDGRSLVYVAHTGQGDELVLMPDVASPAVRVLTTWSHTQTRPTFSPDGQRIAFYSNHNRNDRWDLWVMDVAGGSATQISEGVVLSAHGPSWTPDSASLVYVKDDDNRYDPVMIAAVAAPSGAKPVATGTVGNGDVDVARGTDGKVWLAVAAQGREGDPERAWKRVYVMTLP